MLRSGLETQPRSQGEGYRMEVVYSSQTVSGNPPDLGELLTHSTCYIVWLLFTLDDKSGSEFLWTSPQNSGKIAYLLHHNKHTVILSVVSSSKITALNLPLFLLEK